MILEYEPKSHQGKTFTAVDVETACHDRTSICSIGLVRVEQGEVVDAIHMLINPHLEFIDRFVKIHGIDEDMVANAPNFGEAWPKIKHMMVGEVIVAHNAKFDLDVINKTLHKYGHQIPLWHHICTLEYAKQLLPQLSDHKLPTVAEGLGLHFEGHHDAAADAHAAAQIALKLMDLEKRRAAKNISKVYINKFVEDLMQGPTLPEKIDTRIEQSAVQEHRNPSNTLILSVIDDLTQRNESLKIENDTLRKRLERADIWHGMRTIPIWVWATIIMITAIAGCRIVNN